MKKNLNYFVERNKDTDEIVYIEYDKLDGYLVTPKTKKEDAINVNKIVFVSPTLTEKLIKKKIELKIKRLLQELSDFDEESGSADAIKETLMESEKLKINIINKYLKYLGHDYANLSLEKLQLIINELRYRLFSLSMLNQELQYNNEQERGRRSR